MAKIKQPILNSDTRYLIDTGKELVVAGSQFIGKAFESEVSAAVMTALVLTPMIGWVVDQVKSIFSPMPGAIQLSEYAQNVLRSNPEAVAILDRIHYLDRLLQAKTTTPFDRLLIQKDIENLQKKLNEIYARRTS